MSFLRLAPLVKLFYTTLPEVLFYEHNQFTTVTVGDDDLRRKSERSQPEGLVCEAHGISLRQFYYRCVKVREATASSCLNDVDPATSQEARLCMTADSPVFCEISHVCNTAITSQQRADPDFVPELVLHVGVRVG